MTRLTIILAILGWLLVGVLAAPLPGAAEPAATPPTNDVDPVDWGDPSPAPKATPRTVHAPSGFGRTYLRTPATQAARDWAWRRLGTRQWLCLDALWHHESGWRVAAGRPEASFGIPQAYPGSRMASAGADWRTNPMTQVRWGLRYISGRYGSACGAWSFWRVHRWY